ncbi:MAG: substrate-binding protein [Planctomycetota bacterium]
MMNGVLKIACIMIITFTGIMSGLSANEDKTVKIGLNYPETGPYSVQGLDQLRCAQMATEEINAAGGIMGHRIELIIRDSKSQKDLSTRNAREMIDKEGVNMIFGGSSSGVAIAAGEVCNENKILFFGTLTYSTATTGVDGKKYVFRSCYNSWPGAKVLADHMRKNFAGKKFFYITADYTWGHTTEASFRKFTDTADTSEHKSVLTPFPDASPANFAKAIKIAKLLKPDVLVLVLFGKDMATALQEATAQGLKDQMQIVVPNLTLGMAESAGAENMEGVLGALDWCWKVPERVGSETGKRFVEKFAKTYNRYPSCSGAAAYTILYQYKDAVERAACFDSDAVRKALENHRYTLLKDEQYWREFDHQSVQTVYAVRCKPASEVKKDPFGLDFFEIIETMPGDIAFRTREEWNEVRISAGKPTYLE